MITIIKKEITNSIRSLFHLAKEKLKATVKDIYETQKEFDEQLKRVDEMDEKMNQIVQMKIEINRSIKTTIKKKKTKKVEQIPVSPITIHNEKIDISRYLRKESDQAVASQVKEVLRKINSGELQIGKSGRIFRNNESIKKEMLPQLPSLEKEILTKPMECKEEAVSKVIENKEEKASADTKVQAKELSTLQCIKRIQMIDRFIQKNENSQDFKKLYYVRKCIDLRQDYLAKMRRPVLLSMCKFNKELRSFISEKFIETYEEEDIKMMNSNYYFFKGLYQNYLTEKEVEEVLASIGAKVKFINKKIVVENREPVVLVKEKVA